MRRSWKEGRRIGGFNILAPALHGLRIGFSERKECVYERERGSERSEGVRVITGSLPTIPTVRRRWWWADPWATGPNTRDLLTNTLAHFGLVLIISTFVHTLCIDTFTPFLYFSQPMVSMVTPNSRTLWYRMCSAVGGSRVNYRLGPYFVVLLFFNAPKGNERANASRHPEPANFYSYFMAINFFAVTLFLSRLVQSSHFFAVHSSSSSSFAIYMATFFFSQVFFFFCSLVHLLFCTLPGIYLKAQFLWEMIHLVQNISFFPHHPFFRVSPFHFFGYTNNFNSYHIALRKKISPQILMRF